MGQLTRAQLKALWVLLYKPIQSDYADLFDSFFNLLEDDNVITNAKLAEVAQNIIKGRVSAGAGNVEDLTVADIRAMVIDGFSTTETDEDTTTLTASSTTIQEFTGSTTQTIQMPVVSTLVLGRMFKIINNSTGILTVNSSGSNLITTITAGLTKYFTCVKVTGTDETSWAVNDFGGSAYTFIGGLEETSGTVKIATDLNLNDDITLRRYTEQEAGSSLTLSSILGSINGHKYGEQVTRIQATTDEIILNHIYGCSIRLKSNYKIRISDLPMGSTQVVAGVDTNELWVTSGHATLPNGVIMIGI